MTCIIYFLIKFSLITCKLFLTPVTLCHLPNLCSLPITTINRLPSFVNTSPFIKPLTGTSNNGNNDLKLFEHFQNLIVPLLLPDTTKSEFAKAPTADTQLGWPLV